MLDVAPLHARDLPEIVAAFGSIGWNRPASQYERYLSEQSDGRRTVLVARRDGIFAGYVTLLWRSGYAPFAAAHTPEICDLNVLPTFRWQKVATRLMDDAESTAASRSSAVGIAVGLDKDYGPAQRLYASRGYLPDGQGVTALGLPVVHGESVRIDDDLVLHLTKSLRRSLP